MNVEASTTDSKRPTITEAHTRSSTNWNFYGPFFCVEFHQNKAASNMHFGYQMSQIYLEFGIVVHVVQSISEGRVSHFLEFCFSSKVIILGIENTPFSHF